MDDPGLGVELQAVRAALAAEAAGLHATERGPQVTHVVRVDPGHTGFDHTGDAVRAGQVTRPDVSGQAVTGAVGQPDRVGLVAERGDAHHRAEDLLAEDPHPRLDVGEY